ncbi:MAG: DUF1839 family protein [Hyphomicrobiales bacterium]|nr:DUF1839 family protein [Hyphomicrobiales bacterium]
MRQVIPGLNPATYRPSFLHDAERRWPETNCYVDLLIEVLHAAGHEPAAALGFTVAQDFEGDHFTFFKFPTADLQRLYGIDIEELAVFDRLDARVMTQIGRNRLPMVEVDAFYLPDTRGVSYRISHSKSSIGINALDPKKRRMEYFHNAGYFMLEGADYDALFPKQDEASGLPLFPYSELMKFGRSAASCDPARTARCLLAHHLARRPKENPIAAYAETFAEHAAALADRPPEYFHTYAFNTLRQLGANFELLAGHIDWLGVHGLRGLERAADAAGRISESAKTMQFKLARAMARKRFDGLVEMLAPMVEAYEATMDVLDAKIVPELSYKAA